MFATDRDFLTLEPNLFRDVLWLSQRLVNGPCHRLRLHPHHD